MSPGEAIPCPESTGANTIQGDGHANPAPEVPEGSQAPQLCLNCWLTASQRALLCYPAMNYRINAICSSSSRPQNGTQKPRTLRRALGMGGPEVSATEAPGLCLTPKGNSPRARMQSQMEQAKNDSS